MAVELDFFTRNTGLSFKRLGLTPTGTGTCDTCNSRGVPVFTKGTNTRCASCFMIRKGYPLKGGRQFTLGTADYAVVRERSATIYTSLDMPETPCLQVRPALSGAGVSFYELVLSIADKPPKGPFLLVHFGKPTPTTNFKLNQGTDLLHVSGDTIFGGRNIASIKVWLVKHLAKNYHLTTKEWGEVIASGRDLYSDRNDDRAAKAAVVRQSFGAKYPDLFTNLPEFGTIEHRMLEAITTKKGAKT